MMQNDTPDISSVTAKRAVTLLENWMHSPNGGKRDEKNRIRQTTEYRV